MGSEITGGRLLDTNVSFLGKSLKQLGFRVAGFHTVPDNPEEIINVLKTAVSRPGLVVTTGGLGATMDDLAREAAAEVLGVKLVFHEPSMRSIRTKLARYGRKPLKIEEKQAFHPRGALVVKNPVGIAPGFLVKNRGRILLALPGVPGEMRAMFDRTRGLIKREFKGLDPQVTRLVKCIGLPESEVMARIADLMRDGSVEFGVTAEELVITVSVTAPSFRKKEISSLAGKLRRRLGDAVIASGNVSLAGAVIKLYRKKGMTLTAAESCTGGLIQQRLTSIPGSSEVYVGGTVTYSNELKHGLLGVKKKSLEKYGAVSEEVAREMAEGARKLANADAGLAVTGIAGPGGGSRKKPVGLVYVAVSTKMGVTVKRRVFPGGRDDVRAKAANTGLNMARLAAK